MTVTTNKRKAIYEKKKPQQPHGSLYVAYVQKSPENAQNHLYRHCFPSTANVHTHKQSTSISISHYVAEKG